MLLVMDALLIGKHGQEIHEKKKVYNQLEVDCAVCGCMVKKNKWARHVRTRKHMLGVEGGGGDGKVGGGAGGAKGGQNWPPKLITTIVYINIFYPTLVARSIPNCFCLLHHKAVLFSSLTAAHSRHFWPRPPLAWLTVSIFRNTKWHELLFSSLDFLSFLSYDSYKACPP